MTRIPGSTGLLVDQQSSGQAKRQFPIADELAEHPDDASISDGDDHYRHVADPLIHRTGGHQRQLVKGCSGFAHGHTHHELILRLFGGVALILHSQNERVRMLFSPRFPRLGEGGGCSKRVPASGPIKASPSSWVQTLSVS